MCDSHPSPRSVHLSVSAERGTDLRQPAGIHAAYAKAAGCLLMGGSE